MRLNKLTVIFVALILFIPASTYSDDNPAGKPFKALQEQTSQLGMELHAVQEQAGQLAIQLQNIEPTVEWLIQQAIEQHYKELVFTIGPEESYSFTIPKVQAPVRVEITVSWEGYGLTHPSQIMYAVINQDPDIGHLSWIATNCDGTVEAANTYREQDLPEWIARIGPDFDPHATLKVGDYFPPPGTLMVCNPSNRTGEFIVHLWY